MTCFTVSLQEQQQQPETERLVKVESAPKRDKSASSSSSSQSIRAKAPSPLRLSFVSRKLPPSNCFPIREGKSGANARQIVSHFSRAERDEIMSDVYSLEPPTSGKVILHTTHGEIDIELFSKECPLACRAFVQLCVSKYYEQNVFHRIVKGFMVQTGDKTGTGKGNGWKEGEKFKDEFHSRISFNTRGQVAMANEGKRDSNGSQFFITVDKCRHLDRKHTIFGKVANQTFYNVQRIAECECEGETPVGEPLPRIVRTEVVWNPFADIVVAVPEEKSEEKKEQPKAKKKKQKANVGLLSFCLLYTSPSPRDQRGSRMPSSA